MAGHSGDTEKVEAGLVHSASEVRVVALGAAHRLDLLDAHKLSGFLDDPSIDVRYRAIELAGRLPFDKILMPQLFAALDNSELCEVSCFALGELELDDETKQEAESRLSIVALDHDDPLAREAAVAALGSLQCGLPAILQAAEDVATVRRRAILALAPFEGDAVDNALTNALSDRDWQVRQAAEDLTI